ncbi:MAG: polysaccharide biosynthesis C-terminal domain-containing protein [Eubacteriales bacterium]
MLGRYNHIELVRGYGLCYTVSAPLFIFSSSLQSFIRNDKSPRHAMIAVLTGSGLNILLDYLFIFVFKMGMFGASFATSIGELCITVCILVIHFFTKKIPCVFLLFAFQGIVGNCQMRFSSFLIEESQYWYLYLTHTFTKIYRQCWRNSL